MLLETLDTCIVTHLPNLYFQDPYKFHHGWRKFVLCLKCPELLIFHNKYIFFRANLSHFEPCQISRIEIFAKTVNRFTPGYHFHSGQSQNEFLYYFTRNMLYKQFLFMA